MINAVEFKNWESHEENRIELDPGINVFTGDSDHGKSGLLRGILWAITNKPDGIGHASDWIWTPKKSIKAGKQCSVTVHKDGKKLTRIRTSDMNGYQIDKTALEAIRVGVPAEVDAFFRIGEVNIQKQGTTAFLINQGSSEIARFLNRLVNLTEIDDFISKMESKKRQVEADIKIAEAGLTKSNKDLEKYSWLNSALEQLKIAELMETKVRTLSAQVNELTAELETYDRDIQEYQELSKKTGVAEALLKQLQAQKDRTERVQAETEELETDLAEFDRNTGELDSLRGILTSAESKIKDIQFHSQRIEALTPEIETLTAELAEVALAGDISAKWDIITQAESKIARIQRKAGEITTVQEQIDSLSIELFTFDRDSKELQECRKTLQELIASLPETCPLCGNHLEAHNHG